MENWEITKLKNKNQNSRNKNIKTKKKKNCLGPNPGFHLANPCPLVSNLRIPCPTYTTKNVENKKWYFQTENKRTEGTEKTISHGIYWKTEKKNENDKYLVTVFISGIDNMKKTFIFPHELRIWAAVWNFIQKKNIEF